MKQMFFWNSLVFPVIQQMLRRKQWQPTPVLLPGKSPWSETPGGLQSMGSRRVEHDRGTSLSLYFHLLHVRSCSRWWGLFKFTKAVILQARLQQYVNQMFTLVLEKAEEPEIELPTSAGSWTKQESSRKTSISALLTMPKPLTVWITINCGKFWERWEYQTTWLASWETCMQVRKQQLELDMEQQTGSK